MNQSPGARTRWRGGIRSLSAAHTPATAWTPLSFPSRRTISAQEAGAPTRIDPRHPGATAPEGASDLRGRRWHGRNSRKLEIALSEFLASIRRGKILVDAQVAGSLHAGAIGYEHEAVKIFLPEGNVDENGNAKPVIVPYIRRYPLDTNAARIWLMNHQPERWRERQEVNVEDNLASMTPEQQLARVLEIMARLVRSWQNQTMRTKAEARSRMPSTKRLRDEARGNAPYWYGAGQNRRSFLEGK